MFNGGHVVIYSRNAEADRAVFANVLGLAHVDAGDGWLIFALPQSEIAFHPSETSKAHEFYFMCDDLEEVRQNLASHGIASDTPVDEGYGIRSAFTLPGGSTIGFYQPRHARP